MLILSMILLYILLGVHHITPKCPSTVVTSCPENFGQEWYRADIVNVSKGDYSLEIKSFPCKIIEIENIKNNTKVYLEKWYKDYHYYCDYGIFVYDAYNKWKENNYTVDVLYVDADNDGNISIGDYILLKSKDAGGFFTDDMRVIIRGDFIRGEYRC